MSTDEQVASALLAAIDAQLPANVPAVDHDEHQGLAAKHVQFGLARRFVTTDRSGSESHTAYRMTTRAVADSVSNVREIRRRVTAALDGASVLVGARYTTPIRLESDDQPEPDAGMYSALTTWTFTL